ncbi:MAG: 2-(5''-triphosphoribosyl)-3'-dephosphocoenzyme-A synthase [Methanonatronarchaeales archaeon]|nr:2-(5''-triphosphoribosyl)-3'-dephosphocoenzyme-A synthase [Methanonatronarchaeales archaeon]
MGRDGVGGLAQTALALEVSVTPKPGSVDRCHDFPDTGFEHFLASAVAVGPAVEGAASGKLSLGEAVLMGVRSFTGAQSGGNTHFGALTLLVPLATGFPGTGFGGASRAVEEAGVEDSVLYVRALREAGVGGLGERASLDVYSEGVEEEIRGRGLRFSELMETSRGDDVARELVDGFPRTRGASRFLSEQLEDRGFNEAAVNTFVKVAAKGDSFIRKRHGEEAYRRYRERFGEVADSGFDAEFVRELDREMNYAGVNPGSSADILGAAIFVNLLEGWRP